MGDSSALGTVDLVLLVLSMLGCASVGLYFTNKNKSIEAYMLGDRKQSLIPVAISLMTSCISCLTLLGNSAELYYQGPAYTFISIPILFAGPLAAYTILPVFYRMNELSLYEYLKRRYGPLIKYIVTLVYMIHMVFYNAVALYLPATALQVLFGISKFYSILLIGLLGVLYSSAGGLKAVVWTDFIQAILMYVSVFVVGYIGTQEAGGVMQVIENASEGGRLKFDEFFSFSLTTRHTWLGMIFGQLLCYTYWIGVNQVQIQRAISLPSLRMAQLSFVLTSLFMALICLVSTYVGMVLYSAYQSCDPFLNQEITRRDAIIVHYVANRLKSIPGIRGIFVAGIFSATLSTLSSFANSMSALALEDFVKPLRRKLIKSGPSKKHLEESNGTLLAKLMATGFGIVCVFMAYLIDKANSRLLQLALTMVNAFGVPFLTLFALGIYTRFTNTIGALCSLIVTLTFGSYMVVYQTFYGSALEPSMPLYYNDQCGAVFNMTMSPKQLPPLDQVFSNLHDSPSATIFHSPKPVLPSMDGPFEIGQLSYTLLPIAQFILTILVASIVSVLTGGLRQNVDEECLARPMKLKRENFNVEVAMK